MCYKVEHGAVLSCITMVLKIISQDRLRPAKIVGKEKFKKILLVWIMRVEIGIRMSVMHKMIEGESLHP